MLFSRFLVGTETVSHSSMGENSSGELFWGTTRRKPQKRRLYRLIQINDKNQNRKKYGKIET